MKLWLSTFLCCFTAVLSAQTKGIVTEVKDPSIDSLIARRLELSKKADNRVKKNGPVVSQMGYRVQIFYGSDRREMYRQQSNFKTDYPKLNTYITYKEPNYYLRAGDFRTRLEAQALMNELKGAYPTLFIFKEKINAPDLD
ncbi:SPOR domain-containing protein [Pedobacter sp. MC2016-14]|uniref:SPOR domain-containing protein n=1 Tax=Pedobacter sp. MC2016-14 TaxID=2897327 RepID=UPI001E5A5D56|nr:SPOR domain-containing protein [Pedobacter sp. MC2016-14]MCD0486996.1 SPOR domain-containing protein [Pedobacter sp. MC2016-14]